MGEYINSQNARFDRSHVSCSVLEVHHLPKEANRTVFAIANQLYNKANPRPSAFVMFSDVVHRETPSRGEQLAAAIAKVEAGELLATAPEINPRTGNTIRVWIWHVNHEKFRAWYKDELADRLDVE